jgi:hypothetical protein
MSNKMLSNFAAGYAKNKALVWALVGVFLLSTTFILCGGMRLISFAGDGRLLALPMIIAVCVPLGVYQSGAKANKSREDSVERNG